MEAVVLCMYLFGKKILKLALVLIQECRKSLEESVGNCDTYNK